MADPKAPGRKNLPGAEARTAVRRDHVLVDQTAVVELQVFYWLTRCRRVMDLSSLAVDNQFVASVTASPTGSNSPTLAYRHPRDGCCRRRDRTALEASRRRPGRAGFRQMAAIPRYPGGRESNR